MSKQEREEHNRTLYRERVDKGYVLYDPFLYIPLFFVCNDTDSSEGGWGGYTGHQYHCFIIIYRTLFGFIAD